MSESLDTAAETSLTNRRILITSPQDSAERAADFVTRRGGEALVAPLIQRVPLPVDPHSLQKLAALNSYQWIIFTSAGAVERFFDEIESRDPAQLNATIVAIGERTADRIAHRGYEVAHVAEDHRAEGVVATLLEHGLKTTHQVFFPCADNARDLIHEELKRLGVMVDLLPLYSNAPCTPPNWNEVELALVAGHIDGVAFTSPSAVRQYFNLTGPLKAKLPKEKPPKGQALESPAFGRPLEGQLHHAARKPVFCAIGKTTASELEKHGVIAKVVPAESDIEKMIEALARYFAKLDRARATKTNG